MWVSSGVGLVVECLLFISNRFCISGELLVVSVLCVVMFVEISVFGIGWLIWCISCVVSIVVICWLCGEFGVMKIRLLFVVGLVLVEVLVVLLLLGVSLFVMFESGVVIGRFILLVN